MITKRVHVYLFFIFSVNEQEIQQGILSQDDLVDRCLWFSREIKDIAAHLGNSKASNYIDLMPVRVQRDPVLSESLAKLRGNLTKKV